MDKNIIVIYHGGCTDGFGAAWAAWEKLGDNAEYLPCYYKNPPSDLKDKEIYALDFAFSEELMVKLARTNKLMIIDHHASAEKAVKSAPDYIFDLNHSGSVLAWGYFHPEEEIPMLLKHVEDMDLWRFAIPHTKELISYLDSINFDFETWSKLKADFEDPLKKEEYIEKGKFILDYQQKLVSDLIRDNAELVDFCGYKTMAVNSPMYNSQIGAALARKLPPIGIVWYQDRDSIRISLRSSNEVDVVELARKFGGGGHKAAAGFFLKPGSALPWKKL